MNADAARFHASRFTHDAASSEEAEYFRAIDSIERCAKIGMNDTTHNTLGLSVSGEAVAERLRRDGYTVTAREHEAMSRWSLGISWASPVNRSGDAADRIGVVTKGPPEMVTK